MQLLNDRIALVTGGSRGIGASICKTLAENGAFVFVNYVNNKPAADRTVQEIRELGGGAETIQADVGNGDQIHAMFNRITGRFNGVDIVVNNAGLVSFQPSPIAQATDDYFENIFNINTTGTFRCLREAARCIRPGGRIVNVSSFAAKTLTANYGIYGASKAAVEALTIVLSKELQGRSVTVNAVSPGAIATEDWLKGKNDAIISKVASLSPLGRLGQPADVASVVAFLVTPQAEWINGQIIYLNGGSI